jgi:hypothetical protein
MEESKMQDKQTDINRTDLYERVWSTPMVHLASEFGISNTGLSKICKRHNIPTPPKGYRAKAAAGHKVKKKPLPSQQVDGDRIVIRSQGTSIEGMKKASLPEEFEKAILDTQEKLSVLEPEELPSSPHPLIKGAEKAFKKNSTSYTGTLEPRERESLNIRVTEQSLDRSLSFLDKLFKLSEYCGYELVVMDKGHVALVVLGEKLELRLKERIGRKEVSKANNPALHSRSMLSYVSPDAQHLYTHREYLYTPTGKLCIVAKSPEFYSYERQWCDTDNSRIEDRIGSILTKLIQFAGQSHLKRLQREEYHRQLEIEESERREQYRLWQEELKRIEEERLRVVALIEEAENWQKSNLLRRYIEAQRKRALANHDPAEPESEFGTWLTWAKEQADLSDVNSFFPSCCLIAKCYHRT